MTESRNFRMHEKLLLDVIRKQAGTIQKACLEAVMNSIEAGASQVIVEINTSTILITDNGRGFQSRQEIEQFFETFGQPHTELENKRWAQFRMGRGQLFAFGRNRWVTGKFVLSVDINRRLGYDLQETKCVAPGCAITIDLYEPLNDREIYTVIKELGAFVKYVSIPVWVNDKQVNSPPEAKAWGPETDEDAFVRLNDGNDLAVYNLGVLVCRYPKYTFGVAGTIVSRKRLEVNFARNEVIKSCPVWKRIRAVIEKSDPVANLKRKRVLSEDERISIIERICAGEIRPYDARTVPIYMDVSGHGWSASAVNRAKFATWSYAHEGDRRGDKLIQTGTCLVLDANVLRSFQVEPLSSLFNHRWQDGDTLLCSPPKYVPFADAVGTLNDCYLILPKNKWRPSELMWHQVIEYMVRRMQSLSHDLPPVQRQVLRELNIPRSVFIGLSDTALAWTDGERLVVFNRDYLHNLPLQQYQRPVIGSLIAVAQTLLHELCHDGDSTTQIHSPEFYRHYHDLSDCVGGMVERTWRWLTPKRLRSLAKKHRESDLEFELDEDKVAESPAANREE